MNIMIDFILCILAAAILLSMIGKNTIVAISRFLALVIAVTTATLIATVLARAVAPVTERWNFYRSAAVTDLANLAEVRRLDSVSLTLAQFQAETLVKEKPDEMQELLVRYDTSVQEIESKIGQAAGLDYTDRFVSEMAYPAWRTTVQTILFLLLILILYAVLVSVFRALLYHFFPKDKKRKVPALTWLFALLSVLIVVSYVAVPVLDAFTPYAMGVLRTLRLDSACANSLLYGWCRTLYIL